MATHTRTYRTCDGCGASELDGAVIVESKSKFPNFVSVEDYTPPTLDICADCVAEEKYICNQCHEVHDDAHPCEWQRREEIALTGYGDIEIPF